MDRSGGHSAKSLRLRVASGLALVAFAPPSAAESVEPFRLTHVGGYAEAGLLRRNEDRSRAGVPTTADTDELKIDQLLRVDVAGHVYHPRFLRYRGSGEFQIFEEPREDDVRFRVGGSWNLAFLEQHPYNLSLFGNVQDTEVERTFSQTFDLRSDLYGATFRLRRGFLPFELSYAHRRVHRGGAGADVDESGDDLSFLGRYEVGERSRGRIEYHGTVEEVRDRDIFRQRFFASNSSAFDAVGRMRVTSNVQIRHQKDESNRFAGSAFSSLDWRHRDTLRSRYRVEYLRTDTETQSANSWNLGASLEHQLYESLTSTVDAYGRLEGASFGRTRTIGGSVREAYTKRLGSWGRLEVGVRPSLELIQRRPRQTLAFTLDESAVLPQAGPVELVQRDIDPSTLVVTNSTGAIVYVENFDYRVVVRGRITELERIATGDIAADESVLVDYVYRLPGKGDILARGIGADLSVNLFQSVTLYFRVLSSNQDLLSGSLDTDLESRDRYTAGARWSRGWMQARVEVEKDRSTFRSFRAVSESISVFTRGRSGWRIRLVGSHRYQVFDDFDERVNRLSGLATLSVDVTRRGLLELGADTQWENWKGDDTTGFQDLSAFGVKATFSWRFRSFRVLLGGSLSRVDRHGQQEDADRLFLRLRREF